MPHLPLSPFLSPLLPILVGCPPLQLICPPTIAQNWLPYFFKTAYSPTALVLAPIIFVIYLAIYKGMNCYTSHFCFDSLLLLW